LVAPGILWLLVFFVVPVITLAQTSVAGVEGPWWDAYHRALHNYGTHFFRSFRYALAATLLGLALGYPLAYFIAFRAGKLKNLLLGLVVLPFFTTFLVRTFAWKTILNDGGPAVWLLQRLQLLGDGGRLLDTTIAVVGGLTYNFLPFMILPLFSVVKLIDARLDEAAATLGAGPIHRFLHVTLPLTLPGIVAGTALVFSLAVSAYVIPTLLIGDRYQVMSTIIAKSFLFNRNQQVGSTVGVLLLLIAVSVVVASSRLARDRRDRP